jgi:hypothetical protein
MRPEYELVFVLILFFTRFICLFYVLTIKQSLFQSIRKKTNPCFILNLYKNNTLLSILNILFDRFYA